MAESNNDGIGIAWRDKRSKIIFQRGIKLSNAITILKMIEANKFSYILHFRIATVGGVLRRLCHPFPVTTNQQLLFAKSGEVDYVLAHNGHWNQWDQDNATPPFKSRQGPWSDSAALAYIAAKTGTIWIPSGNRICTLHSKDGLKIMDTPHSGTWTHKDGYHLSNNYWDRSSRGNVGYGYWANDYDQCEINRTTTPYNSNYKGNKYSCVHHKFFHCDECLPTHNTMPIEVLPNAQCSYTFEDNGVLLGVPFPNHSCQHKGHWHCGDCTNSCAPIRDKLTRERAEAKAKTTSTALVVSSNRGSNTTSAIPTTPKPTNVYRLDPKRPPRIATNLPTDPTCISPGYCGSVATPCSKCQSFRTDLSAIAKANDIVTELEVNRQSALAMARKAVEANEYLDSHLCIHNLPIDGYCKECEIGDLHSMAESYLGSSSLLNRWRKL